MTSASSSASSFAGGSSEKSIAATLSHVDMCFEGADGPLQVLFNITTTLSLGQLTMLVGPSGCGKTTLLSIISGILLPTRGRVVVDGVELGTLSDTEKTLFRRKRIGFIFQQYNLLPSLTAAENAGLPLVASGVTLEDAAQQARVLLAEMDMKAHADKLPRQLSGGQQQRVAIARALVHNPKMIVCDEPTAALDGKAGQGVMAILRHISNDPQRCVLLVTHDSRIFHFADRVLEMSDGYLTGDTSSKNSLSQTFV